MERDSKGRFITTATKTNEMEREMKRFTTTKKTLNFDSIYPGIAVIIERAGQEKPEDGDRVIVKATLVLPADEKNEIVGDIQFRTRVHIFEEDLYSGWGYYSESEDGIRINVKKFFSEKWQDGFIEAEEYIVSELEKLDTAIQNRKKKLEEAE